MMMMTLLTLVMMMMMLTPSLGLEIESLAVPELVVAGDSAVMACYYSVPDTRLPELDIKWYHGARPEPFMVSGVRVVGRVLGVCLALNQWSSSELAVLLLSSVLTVLLR